MFNTISGAKLAVRSKKLFANLCSIARQTGLIVRHSRKFSADGFVLSLLQAVTSGGGSFNQIAVALALSGTKPLSRQALWNRVDANAVNFMMEVVRETVEQRWSGEVLIASEIFDRLILEDSSQIKLPAGNHEDFPAHGNGKGATAGCKFDLAFDLLTGEPILQSLRLATDQDKELGKDLVDLVKRNDLVLRDMGYFSLGEFSRIEALDAWWLSRLPSNVLAWDLKGRKLEDILQTTNTCRLDLTVCVGEVRHRCRLIAVRAAPDVAAQRRRERRKQAEDHGKQISKQALVRCDWHIILTNVRAEEMTAENLFKLYGVRWNIEIGFRAWKQCGHLAKALARRSNIFHLQVLMLAGILLLIMLLKITRLLQGSRPDLDLSIEKVADHLGSFLLRMTSLSALEHYNPDPRHVKMDRRNRENLRNSALNALS
jgi:IS4 transposase